jgi:arylsulfatase A-like enzyme
MQGQSLKPLLQGDSVAWRDHIYYSYYENTWAMRALEQAELSDPSFSFFTAHRIGPHRGIRNDRYKLIEYYSENNYWEFFDLQEDPNELKNVFGDPAYAALVKSMTVQLRETQEGYRDLNTWDQLSLPNYTD